MAQANSLPDSSVNGLSLLYNHKLTNTWFDTYQPDRYDSHFQMSWKITLTFPFPFLGGSNELYSLGISSVRTYFRIQ